MKLRNRAFSRLPAEWNLHQSQEPVTGQTELLVRTAANRRHGVDGGVGRIIEYYGPGLDCLAAMDRHVIANMGAELGATTSVFPSNAEVRGFLRS